MGGAVKIIPSVSETGLAKVLNFQISWKIITQVSLPMLIAQCIHKGDFVEKRSEIGKLWRSAVELEEIGFKFLAKMVCDISISC